MSAGVTFERVYRALKEQVCGGRFTPGEHLEPAALSQTLNASITPVRDALHRLAGEGLVESPRGDGFRLAPVTEVGLRNLYRWNAALLDLAVRTRARDRPVPDPVPERGVDTVELTERVFLALAGRSVNPEHPAAIAHLNDRLRAVRQTELTWIEDAAAELDDLRDSICEGATGPLRRSLNSYHRRREKLVSEVVAALHAPR